MPPPVKYDVFLSYNRQDWPAVEGVARWLRGEGIEPWLDAWCLVPGRDWKKEVEKALGEVSACALFIGKNSIHTGQTEELIYATLRRRRAELDGEFRIIPVILPGGDKSWLPEDLKQTTWVAYDPGDGGESLRRLRAGIRGDRPGPSGPGPVPTDRCPYRGLQLFDEADADFFFGRRALVEQLTKRLASSVLTGGGAGRLLTMIGASGCGKSSVARAGLLPALRRGALPGSKDWAYVVFRPGADPLEGLAVALAAAQVIELSTVEAQQLLAAFRREPRALHQTVRLALSKAPERKVLLLIDQFEEVFTLCQDEPTRAAFVANLHHASTVAQGPAVVLLTVRADFFGKCTAYPDLGRSIAQQLEVVGALTESELREAIEEPALRAGVRFEPGLVEKLVAETVNRPGALPLLQHALLELWLRREGATLTHAAYKQIEGIGGALRRRADQFYAALTKEQQATCRRIFLRLTQPGEGTEDTRRRVPVRALSSAGEDLRGIETVLAALADPQARLVALEGEVSPAEDQRFVELAHEALIQTWPTLRGWIEEDRGGLLIHRGLERAAAEWLKSGRKPEYLYAGTRLRQAEQWARRHGGELNEGERAFLRASQRQRARGRALRVAAGVAGLVVLTLGIWAVVRGFEVEDLRKRSLVAQELQKAEDLEKRAEKLTHRSLAPTDKKAVVEWFEEAGKLVEKLDERREWHGHAGGGLEGGEGGAGSGGFALSEEQQHRRNLDRLVRSLERLKRERGRKEDERFSMPWVRWLMEESLERHKPEWDRAKEAIRKSEMYKSKEGHLELGPQVGLVPLGPNERGLWEFADLKTGRPPNRGPNSKLVLEKDTGVVFVLIPGGELVRRDRTASAAVSPVIHLVGSQGLPWAALGPLRIDHARAAPVTIQPFFLSKYEMTQGQWAWVHRSNPSFFDENELPGHQTGALHPVETVSWDVANTAMSNLGMELPLSDEWEYACRAGTQTAWYCAGSREEFEQCIHNPKKEVQPSNHAHYGGEGDGSATAEVGQLQPNPFGLHDMYGNVAEWCKDGPPGKEEFRFNRGGSRGAKEEWINSWCALEMKKGNANYYVGVRPARQIKGYTWAGPK